LHYPAKNFKKQVEIKDPRVRSGSDRVRRGSDEGAAWLSRVRRGSAGCGVAQIGCCVAQLGCGVAQIGCGVAQRGCGVVQVKVRRGSDQGAAWLREGAPWFRLGCGVAQIVARRLAVRQARV
jgi:hypothetical protein